MKTLKVANGLVKGQVKNILGKDIVGFLSIPYCKPPINELRFQRPQPCDTFSNEVINKMGFETSPPGIMIFDPDILQSNDEKDEFKFLIAEEKQDEDCLYVNIWCPLSILEGKKKRPVLIWIYGGGFVCGSSSSDMYRGDVLASHEDIIVVSFNYRVGALGFLCLDDMGLNGNLGIWDQALALRWIHDNISVFNGDPENITISGCSAGGFSVTLHLLIEESWPNFHKAISESGICFSKWGLQTKEESVRRSVKTVNKVLENFQFPLRYDRNLQKHDKKSIIDFLQSLDFKEFLIDSEIAEGFLQFVWGPCVDGELIKCHPRSLLKENKFKKCPIIILTSENEGSIFTSFMFRSTKTEEDETVDMKYFEKCFEYYPQYPIKCKDSVKTKIKKEYNIQHGSIPIHVLDKIVADQYFNCDSIEFAKAISTTNREVYYIWHRNSIPFPFFDSSRGAPHGSEMFFMFGIPLRHSPYDCYIDISKIMMSQIGKFLGSGHLDQGLPYFDEVSKSFIDVYGKVWKEDHFQDDQMNKVKFWRDLENDL